MFNVGDIAVFKITGEKVMVLRCDRAPAIGEGEDKIIYTVRLPDYRLANNVQEFELAKSE